MKENRSRHVNSFRRWTRKGYAVFASLRVAVRIGVLSVSMSILLLTAELAKAQTSDTSVVAKSIRIDPVEAVSRGSYRQSAVRSLTAMHSVVFDRNTEAGAPLQTIESALRLSPAVDLRERGGKGIQADISLRGGSFDQTAVMLNGVRFTDARTGHQSHSLPVDIESVSDIEIYDGVSGVGAYAGAVDIRTAPVRPRYLRLETTGGDKGYAYTGASGAYTGQRLTVFGAASYRRSDGYVHNTDFSNVNGFTRITYDSRRAGFFDFQAGYQNRRFGANGFYSLRFPDQFEHTSTALGSVRWFKTFGRLRLASSLSYRKNYDRFEMMRGRPQEIPYNYHNTDNVGFDAEGSFAWKGGTTSVGGDIVWNHIWSTVLGDKVARPRGRYDHAKSRTVGDVWMQHIMKFGLFDAMLSAASGFTPYGTRGLFGAFIGFRPTPGVNIRAAALQSMRLPTFTDLYYTATGYVANPYLHPETAVTYSLSAEYSAAEWSVKVLSYYRRGRNIIDWLRSTSDGNWHSMQVTRLGTWGAEFGFDYLPGGFMRRISVSYAYVTTSKASESYISKYALDYLRHKAAISCELRLPWRLSLALTGSVYDRNGNYSATDGTIRSYKPYFLLDGRLAWEKGNVKIYLDATNITDAGYYDFGGLRMPGIWLSGGLVVTI